MSKYCYIKQVKPVEDYKLILTFSNGEKRLFDAKPYLNKGIFKELLNIKLFNTAHISFDTVEWDNQADLDPEMLYSESKKIRSEKYSTTSKTPVISVAEPRRKYRKKK